MTSPSRSRLPLLRRALAAAALVAGTVILAGCGSMIADHLPSAAGGLPEATPQRPATPAAYPAVHDMPPPRATTVLTETEQRKLEDDLVATRNRAAGAAGPPAGVASKP
jgi:hypothetical protein